MEKKKLRNVVKQKSEVKYKDKKPQTVMIWDGKWREVPICSR